MKRRLAVMAALLLGIGSFSLGSSVLAGELGEALAPIESPVPEESMEPAESPVSAESPVPTESPVPMEHSVSTGNPIPTESPSPTEDPVPTENSEFVSLEIPEKLSVVLNPWEMDGREQIYSEQYTIQNTGSTAGILKLSFRCVIPEGSEVMIQSDKEGLHEGETKSIYIEVIFGEDRIALSQEDSEYQTELEPGETLQVSFSGGMNASASEPWQNGDIEINGIYSWDPIGSTGEAIVNQEG